MPEIASREHLQHLFPLITRALGDAKLARATSIASPSPPAWPHRRSPRRCRRRAGSCLRPRHPLIRQSPEGHIFLPTCNAKVRRSRLPERFLSLVISGGHSRSTTFATASSPCSTGRATTPSARRSTRWRSSSACRIRRSADRKHANGPRRSEALPFPMPQFNEKSVDPPTRHQGRAIRPPASTTSARPAIPGCSPISAPRFRKR